MSTLTAQPARTAGGLPGTIAAEWTKLWSVRSTWWSLVGGAAMMALFAGGLGIDTANPPDDAASMPPSELILPAQEAAAGGLLLTQFALVALAVLVVTTEYSTGSIRSTLQWDPRRGRVLVAKVAVLAPVLFVAGAAIGLLGAVVADLCAGDYGSFVPAEVATEVARIGLYVAVAGAFAAGLGLVLRSTAGTLTTAFLLLLLLPMVLLPTGIDPLVQTAEYLPGTAGMKFVGAAGFLGVTDLPYGSGAGLAIFLGWAVAAALAGYAVLRRRDA